MSIRIAHISDTHLGTRPREGVRQSVWGVEMRARLLENDFYERFAQLFDIIAGLDPKPDLVVHSGDLYDSPWEGNPLHPPVYAEQTALTILKSFVEKTGIPVLILEGNHGLYRTVEVSLLDLLRISIPGVQVATQVQLKKAITDGTPLKVEYDTFDVFCFPFIEQFVLESSGMVDDFQDWMTTHQRPNSGKPSIAVAHGMDLDKSLFSTIFSMNYDYIALGHDHHQHKHSENAWYAGSPERWRFDETRHKKGFLIVDLEAGEKPKVTPYQVTHTRPVVSESIVVEPDDTIDSVRLKVEQWLEKNNYRAAWDSPTAARIRLVFEGESSRIGRIDLTIMLESMRVEILSDNSGYNIAQFVWSVPQIEKERDAPAYPEIVTDYLIEDPTNDFTEYLATVKLDAGLDVSRLTDIAVKAMRLAVKRDGERMSMESFVEGDSS